MGIITTILMGCAVLWCLGWFRFSNGEEQEDLRRTKESWERWEKLNKPY